MLVLPMTVHWLSGGLFAQTDTTKKGEQPAPAVETVEGIEAAIKRVTDLTDQPEEVKTKTIEFYRQAIDQIRRTKELQQTAANYRMLIDSADERLATIQQKLADAKADSPKGITGSSSLPELEKELAARTGKLQKIRDTVIKSEADATQRAVRRKEIPARQLKVQADLDAVIAQLGTVDDDNSELNRARKIEMRTHRRMLEAELPALANELELYQAEELIGFERVAMDLNAALEKLAEKELLIAQEVVQGKRVEVASQQIEKADQAVNQAGTVLRPLAVRLQTLAQDNKTITEEIEKLEKQLSLEKDALAKLEIEYKQTTERVKAIGLTAAVGKRMRQERLELEKFRQHRASIAELKPLIDKAQLDIFELKAERSKSIEPTVRKVINDSKQVLTAAEYRKLFEDGTALVEKKNDFLDPLITILNKYSDKLVERKTTLERLITLTETYRDFIDARVLWIRSDDPLISSSGIEKPNFWFTDVSKWKVLLMRFAEDLKRHWAFYLCGTALLCGWVFFRRKVLETITEIGRQVRRSSFTRFLPTLQAIALTFLSSLPLPLCFAFAGWRLSAIAGGEALISALSVACWNVAWGLVVLKFLRQTCRDKGLAESHFQWAPDTVSSLRKHIPLLMYVALPLVFLNTFLGLGSQSVGEHLLPTLCFIALMIVVGLFLFRLLHPERGVFKTYIRLHREGWLARLQGVWFWLAVAAPTCLALLAFSGYYFTAEQLSFRLFTTSVLLTAVAIVFGFFERLLLVNRRRLSIEEAQQRRAALEAEQRGDGEPAPLPQELAADENPLEELRAQTAQSQRLLKTVIIGIALGGVWLIWTDVVPALGFFDRWPIWTNTIQVTEAIETANGEVETRTHDELRPVTIVHLIVAILIAIVTFVAARNIPGALEIGVLRGLPLDNSIRYAITSLVSYAIILLGIFIAFSTIGLRWNQIQWMATALTFGLAFGLQEMFANFVAGIIILFERPIRVGDLVTIDETTGVVKRIRIRATTITSLERKDYVVPNKEFITGRLLNWTLSDPIIRLEISVGIAYGSDTQLASKLLLQVGNAHSEVLKEPAPAVIFNQFGDNSLNFWLRVFVTSAEKRFEIINDLHMAIDREFRNAKIEIAFPQRDLYLKGIPDEVSDYLANRGNEEPERSIKQPE